MAPPIKAFDTAALPQHVQHGPDGRRRKTAAGAGIDLARDCELATLLQYECLVRRPEMPNSPVECWPVRRWFRRCQDLKANFTVETTKWETKQTLDQAGFHLVSEK